MGTHGSSLLTKVGLVGLGLILAAAAAGVALVLSTSGFPLTVVVLVLVAGSSWLACTRRTSLALTLFVLYLGLLDGYLKLASGSSQVTLVRDVLLYALVVGMIVRAQVAERRLALPPLSAWIGAYVVVILVQLANPHGGTLVHSLTGVRQHLEFVPLFFLGYVLIRDVTCLRRCAMILLVLGAANGVAGYVQFTLTPEQLASWGPGYAQRINGTGAFAGAARTFADAAGTVRVRPFGLGSDIGAGGVFGALAIGSVLALGSLLFPLRYRLIGMVLGVGAVAAIVTSQGRAVVVAAVATALAFGVLTATGPRRIASLAGITVAAALTYFVVTSIVATAGSDAFRYQGLTASKILETTSSGRGRRGQVEAIAQAINAYPLGAGLGTAGPASATPGGSPLTGKLNAESEFSFLVIESGVPGLMVVVGFTVLLLGLGLSRCRREPDPEVRVLLAGLISPIAGILIVFYSGPATVGVPDGPFLWFVGGVLAYWLVALPAERKPAQRLPSGPTRHVRRNPQPRSPSPSR
jgi:hypothetical protein